MKSKLTGDELKAARSTWVNKLSSGKVFSVVIESLFRSGQFRHDDHQEDATLFITRKQQRPRTQILPMLWT